MEAAVVGPIISATLKELLTNLISLSGEKISPIRNFKKNLMKLKEYFEMIQAFLIDAEKKQVTDGSVRLWLKKLKAVAFEADDVLDELDYLVLRKKNGTKCEKAKAFFSVIKIASKIRRVIKKLKLINEAATEFGLQRNAHASSSVSESFAERETDSYVDDQIVVGRENYVSRIVDILTSSSPTHDEEEVFRVLPIVGMGGLGKTTTAKSISEETKRWDDFRDALSSVTSTKGNGIILTTRSKSVASIVGTIRIDELSKLRDEDCWSIIKGKTFQRGCLIPSEFEIIGRKIAEKCQGLPLAANVIGGLLRGKSKEEWHSVEESGLSN